MHRFERRVAWVSVALLAVCALGATRAAWPSNVNEQADAVVQHVVSQSNVHAALAVTPGPAPATTAGPPAAAAVAPTSSDEPPAPPEVEMVGFSASNGPRSFAVTVWYPAAPGRYPLVVLAHGYGASASSYEDMEVKD